MSDVVSVIVDIPAVMEDLAALKVRFPVDALRTIQSNRELFIPHLIKAIEDECDCWEDEGGEPEGQAAFFALFLLTEFAAFEAWPTFRRVLLLTDDGTYELYGDATSECFPRMLAFFAQGKTDILEELLNNPDVERAGYLAAVGAYQCLVRDQHLTREAAVDTLRGHLRKAMASQDSELCTLIGSELLDYCPTEAAEEIRTALRENLIEDIMFDEDDLDRALDDGLAGMQAHLLQLKPTGIPDTVAELQTWAGFQEPQEVVRRSSRTDDEYLDDEPEAPKAEPLIHQLERQMGTLRNTERKVGRNEPCPCGSGAKSKKCCGKS